MSLSLIYEHLKEPFYILLSVMVFFAVNVIGFYIIFYRRDEQKRTRAIKGLPVLIGVVILFTFAYQITMSLSGLMLNVSDQTDHPLSSDITDAYELEPMDGSLGFVEKLIIDGVDLIVDSMIYVREVVLGESIDIKTIIFGAKANPLVSLDVPLKGGGSLNLYSMVMSIASVVILFMVIKTAFTALRFAYDEHEGKELRASLLRWINVPVMIGVAPLFYIAFVSIVGEVLRVFSGLDFTGSYVDIFGLDARDYGLGISAAKLYMLFIEFKLWVIMFSREIILNALYIMIPLSIALSAHPKEFDSLNVLLNLMMKFLFMPFTYGLAYIVVMMVMGQLPNGNNPIVIIIGMGMIFSVADIFIVFLAVRQGVHPNRVGGISGQSVLAGAAMTAMAFSRSLSSSNQQNSGSTHYQSTNKSGGLSTNLSKSSRILSQSVNKVAIQAAQKIGLDKGMVTGGGQVFAALGKGIAMTATSRPARATLSSGVAMVASAATGNPVVGAAAYGAATSLQKKLAPGIVKSSEGLMKTAGQILPAVIDKGARLTFGDQAIDQSKSFLNERGKSMGHYFASTDSKCHKRR